MAANLATGLREFTISCDYQSVPCSASPRSATRNLVVLFGPAAGSVTISTRIEALNLPAFKRRALVLLALVLLALDLLAMVLLALDLASTALTDGFHRQGPAMSKGRTTRRHHDLRPARGAAQWWRDAGCLSVSVPPDQPGPGEFAGGGDRRRVRWRRQQHDRSRVSGVISRRKRRCNDNRTNGAA